MDDRLLFTLFGACAVGIVAYIREIVARRTDRAERVRDVQIALCAEIRAYLAVLKRDDLDSFERKMTKKMKDNFVPFVSTEDNNSLFKVIAPNVHVLPESSIDPGVVDSSQAAALAKDQRSDASEDVQSTRRTDIYRSFLSLPRAVITLGTNAHHVMQPHLRGGDLAVVTFQKDDDRTERAFKRWICSTGSIAGLWARPACDGARFVG
ncbi:MAG: hypothetical protein AAFR93_04500 [Pseudomonadota bacterium]